MIDEQRNILAAFTQRRNLEPHDIQSIEEILAETTRCDFALEVARRGGDDPNVDLDGLGFSDGSNFLFLDCP